MLQNKSEVVFTSEAFLHSNFQASLTLGGAFNLLQGADPGFNDGADSVKLIGFDDAAGGGDALDLF